MKELECESDNKLLFNYLVLKMNNNYFMFYFVTYYGVYFLYF